MPQLSTSFVYVLLSGPHCVLGIADLWMLDVDDCTAASKLMRGYLVAWAVMQPIYAYNFFVYVITGQRFRLELCQLFRCCCRGDESPTRAVFAAGTDVITLRRAT